jgi:hypothetical protein
MKPIPILLLLLSFATAPTLAQDLSRIRQTIDTLTSATMHGRGYIREGDAKAALYISSRFQQMGLKPFGDAPYFQKFSFPVNTISKTPQLEVAGKVLQPGRDFVANAASAPGKGTANIVPLDTTIFNDATAAQRFFKQKLKGKAIVYRQQDQPKLSQLPQPYQQKLQQARLHIKLEPKALLTTVARRQAPLPVLEVLEQAWPQNAKQLTFGVAAQLKQAHETQNVIAYIEGSTQPDSFLVFSAHYDHLGGQGDVYFPGANDNASGTAMLLALAEHYSKPENKPAYSIAFMAFAAEEAGLLGSLHYVNHPLFPLPRIRFLVNLDLLGTGSEGMMVVNGKVHEQEFKLLQQLNAQHQYLPQLKSRGKAANSDHYPFSEKGVPAFFFYTLGGTAAYHNTNDHPQQLPLTEFGDIFQLIVDFAAEMQQ